MTDPKRWSEARGELNADERRVFEAGHQARAPRAAKRAVWLALGAQLPTAAAAASTGTALTAVSLLKSAGIGLVLGASTMGGVAVVRQQTAPAPPVTSTPAARVRAPVASAPPSPLVPAPVLRAPPPPDATVAPVIVAPPARHSGAAETGAPLPPLASEATFPDDTSSAAGASNESRRVAEARVLLRAGRSRESLAVLERIGREIPNGALAQEREALAIEALLALGQREVARSRAVTFLARHPRSPHAAAARRALE